MAKVTKRSSKPKQKIWFKYVRKSYLPITREGLAIYMVYVVYLIVLSVFWYFNGHKLSYLMLGVLPLQLTALFLMQTIAASLSKKGK